MSTTLLTNSEFISKIIQDADTGRCFVPFIGSGLSSPSGIIMGMEFTNYLAFTTYLVLSDPIKRQRTHGEGVPSHWNLRHQGWPPLPTDDEVQRARNWILVEFQGICKRLDLEINYDANTNDIKSLSHEQNQPPSHELLTSLVHPQVPMILASANLQRTEDRVRRLADLIIRHSAREQKSTIVAIDQVLSNPRQSYKQRLMEMGVRALHDWRETLMFLASVTVNSSQQLVYTQQLDSVIDRFNTFITRDKQPNLGHKSLAHLIGPLRICSILTTNFDTLTEDAFRSLNLRLRVLPVSSKGQLPEAQTVGAEDSLVKLHGEAQDTRADMTLDEEPSKIDTESFKAYLTRGSGNLCSTPPKSESKRLLVLGYSGSDHRCVQMIKHWLETGPDNPVVYWVCFSNNDVKHVERLFFASEYQNKVRVTQSARPDLLLHELYQRLVLSLPPGGLTYEFSHVVPPRRFKEFDFDIEQVKNLLDCAREGMEPIEASRVLLPESDSPKTTRQLCRDAMALDIKKLILRVLNKEVMFYNQNGIYRLHKSAMSMAGIWRPFYRSDESNDEELKKNINSPTKTGDENIVFRDIQTRPIIIDSLGGVVRAVAQTVDELTATTSKKIFWLETQDYMDADALLRDLLRSIAVRCGSFQSQHVTQHPLSNSLGDKSDPSMNWADKSKKIAEHFKRILDDYRVDSNQIIVLIYGRDSYGGCSGLIPAPWNSSSSYTKPTAFHQLHCVIEALGRVGIPTFYFSLSKERSGIKNHFPKSDLQPIPWPESFSESSNWENARDKYDKWREWPYDPFHDSILKTVDKKNSMQNMSVYNDITKSILHPYFDFKDEQATPRKNTLTQYGVRKLLFLYALTLFRHSRHTNALCSEAVFHCPHRFNANGIDNDYLRSEEAIRWISELREARIFFDKPGGSSWMHRDIRLTIQNMLEHIDIKNLAHPKSNSKKSQNYHLSELRSRLHFWIGDWYQKAFCSSGHLTPVIESVHHRLMAALYSPFAAYKHTKPTDKDKIKLQRKNIIEYRCLLFEAAIREAHRSLYLAWQALKLWQANTFEVSWIGKKHRTEIDRLLTKTIEELSPRSSLLQRRIELAKNELLQGMEALSEELVLTGGGGTDDRSSSPLPNPVSSTLTYSPVPTKSGTSGSVKQNTLKLDHGWKQINKPESEFRDHINTAFSNKQVGGKDTSNLCKSIDDIGDLSIENKTVQEMAEKVIELSKNKASWKSNSAGDPQKLHDTIWLLGESAYMYVRRAKLTYHATHQIQSKYWIKATIACNLGIDLCKHLPPWLLRFEIESKVKLHTIYGISLANLGRFFEATRHLNEAQAILSKFPAQSPADVAIIKLRRAEALLTECIWMDMFLDESLKRDIEIEKQYDNLIVLTSTKIKTIMKDCTLVLVDGRPDTEPWSEMSVTKAMECGTKRTVLVPSRITECFRKSYNSSCAQELPNEIEVNKKWIKDSQESLKRLYASTLDESISLLDQSEFDLRGYSQSSLWWSRLHTLRLRVYGLLTPLGQKANESLILRKQSTDTGIFESFRNAIRIAMDDPFRQYRALKYFFMADKWHREFGEQQEQSSNPQTKLPNSYGDALSHLKNLIQDSRLHTIIINQEKKEEKEEKIDIVRKIQKLVSTKESSNSRSQLSNYREKYPLQFSIALLANEHLS